ncbi:hypothetical protein Tco_0448215 [Tanacetum coccineum]
MEDTLSKFMSELAKRHEENSNLIKEIRAKTNVAIRNQGASIKTLEIQIGQMSKVLQERGFRSLPSSTKTNPRDQVKSISTTIEADSHSYTRYMDHPKTPYPLGQNKFTIVQVKIKKFLYQVVWIIITVEKRESWTKIHRAYGASHINNTIPRNEKDPGSFTLPCFINDACFDNALVDLGASAYWRDLVLNRSLDPFLEDYIELNDLNEPFELRRNQGDDLMPIIQEGEVIEEFRTRDKDLDIGIDDYPILEDMDAYRDEGMGDIIVGEPFLREVRIKAKCFKEDIYPLLMVKMKLAKGAHSGSLNEDILKITILKTNTPYPSRKIRRICACTHQRPQRNKDQYAIFKENQYAVFKIWNQYNILEDIKRGPYSTEITPVRRIQHLIAVSPTDFPDL